MKIKIEKDIVQTQTFEVAAWYENWVLTQGTYELKRLSISGDFGPGIPKVSYEAEVPATLESDNFQSLFGGLACGKSYDQNQNKGKIGTRNLSFSPEELLGMNIECSEEEYDRLLSEAATRLRYDINGLIRCISSNVKTPEWLSGHAKNLYEKSKLYADIQGVIGRREYNKLNGGKGWSEKELKV